MELQFLFTKATSHNWPCACACVKVFITVWSWQLLAKKKNPHQGMINTTNGTSSFHVSRLSRHPSLLAHGNGSASKGAGSTSSERRGLPGLCSTQTLQWYFFFYSLFGCAAKVAWVTPPPNAVLREIIGLMGQSNLWQQMWSLLGHFCTWAVTWWKGWWEVPGQCCWNSR